MSPVPTSPVPTPVPSYAPTVGSVGGETFEWCSGPRRPIGRRGRTASRRNLLFYYYSSNYYYYNYYYSSSNYYYSNYYYSNYYDDDDDDDDDDDSSSNDDGVQVHATPLPCISAIATEMGGMAVTFGLMEVVHALWI